MKIMQLSTPQNGRCVYVCTTVWRFKIFFTTQILCKINHTEFRVLQTTTAIKLMSQKMMTGKFLNFHNVVYAFIHVMQEQRKSFVSPNTFNAFEKKYMTFSVANSI